VEDGRGDERVEDGREARILCRDVSGSVSAGAGPPLSLPKLLAPPCRCPPGTQSSSPPPPPPVLLLQTLPPPLLPLRVPAWHCGGATVRSQNTHVWLKTGVNRSIRAQLQSAQQLIPNGTDGCKVHPHKMGNASAQNRTSTPHTHMCS
jgi:hypothetical protein